MLPHNHEHRLQPFRVYDRPDGYREIQSYCNCAGPDRPEIRYEEKLIIDTRDGRGLGFHVRFGGVWYDPVDLVQLARPFEICPECHALPQPIEGMVCSVCNGLGVLRNAEAIRARTAEEVR